MYFVLLSVFCSVSVAILIKYCKQNGVNHLQLVVWNYPSAAMLAYFLLSPSFIDLSFKSIPWRFYLPLSFLLPSLFVCIAYSIQYTGVIKTEVAQRLSLFIPLLAAYLIFKENLEAKKLFGILLGFIAIILCLSHHRSNDIKEEKMYFPFIVFFGMGVIDVLFKKIAQSSFIPFGETLLIIFLMAMIFAFLYYFYLLKFRKEKADLRSVYWGLFLGVLNFGNILFYLKAHQAIPNNPSIVFSAMNIGVIVVGAISGAVLFKEKLTVYNKIGLLIAILSVVIISYA